MKKTSYTLPLGETDVVDVALYKQGGRVIKFSLNYRARIQDRWRNVYRIDNCHESAIHEHRFWRNKTNQRSVVQEYPDMELMVDRFIDMIKENHRRFRGYMGDS